MRASKVVTVLVHDMQLGAKIFEGNCHEHEVDDLIKEQTVLFQLQGVPADTMEVCIKKTFVYELK